MMQRFSRDLKSGVEYRAAGPFDEASEPPAASWEELERLFDRRGAWPSPMLIQFLGAYGVSLLEERPGAKGDPRRAIAIDQVVKHLGPFMAGQPRAGQKVFPEIYGDSVALPETVRESPVTLELAAEVAIYVGAPGEEDTEYDGNPGGPRRPADELDTAPSAVEYYAKLIRNRLPPASRK
jgi:hypothetical protein